MLSRGGAGSTAVDLWELEDQFGRGRRAPSQHPLLQGPNLGEGDLLWGRGLGVGQGRLGLVPTRRTARAGAGTARGPSIKDHTPCRHKKEDDTKSLYKDH